MRIVICAQMKSRAPYKYLSICLFGIFYSFVSSPHLAAQVVLCNGNLGNNIFSEGDFGSGIPNVVQTNPGLAPGFTYTTQVPPDDGEYTLTNNMAAWSSGFPSWLRIRNNDSDPNGYMMVVNASFSPGIFYEQIIEDLCDNTLYEFSADVINLIRAGTTGHLLPNVSFFIDDALAYSSGSIPQDERWHTYGFTFTTGPGQTTVKLSLRNNAPGGIGNDLALDNIEFRPCGPTSSVTISPAGKICENSLFPILTAQIEADTGAVQWQISYDNGFVWTDIPGAVSRTHQVQQLQAGQYYFRYLYSTTLANNTNPKCRIVSDFILIDVVPVEFLIRDTICEGMTFSLGDMTFDESGIYQQLLTASNGCDSMVTLDLVVIPDPPIVVDFRTDPTSCEGAADGILSIDALSGVMPPFMKFFINGNLVPAPNTFVTLAAGTYTARIEDQYGCFDEQQIVIADGPTLMIQTIEDTIIRLGHSVLLQSQTNIPMMEVSWTPTENVECPVCLSTTVMPFNDQAYIITAMTDQGCSDSDTVNILVDRTPVFYIPNVFSPNGDQVNDHFTFSPDPLIIRSVGEVVIFDRWGGVIFRKTGLQAEPTVILWDGESGNKPSPTGTYVYFISFTLADSQVMTIHGDITLLR